VPSSPVSGTHLPEDLKIWSPTHPSAYLSSTLYQVMCDITVFVKEEQITGKTFMRVIWRGTSELPTAHCTHHLSASRSLGQHVLRGLIKGFESGHSFPVHYPQDDDFLPMLIWGGGAGTPASILLPMTTGEFKA
ncbi:hypothetical protein K443DRAFT_90437, partial [Laccaria amethystina LaAM-08-1]